MILTSVKFGVINAKQDKQNMMKMFFLTQYDWALSWSFCLFIQTSQFANLDINVPVTSVCHMTVCTFCTREANWPGTDRSLLLIDVNVYIFQSCWLFVKEQLWELKVSIKKMHMIWVINSNCSSKTLHQTLPQNQLLCNNGRSHSHHQRAVVGLDNTLSGYFHILGIFRIAAVWDLTVWWWWWIIFAVSS